MQVKVYLAKGLDDLDPSDAAAIAKRFPVAIDGGTIRLSVLEDDPVLNGVRAELLRLGFHPTGGTERRHLREIFEFTRYRIYDESDLAACELLKVVPRHRVQFEYMPPYEVPGIRKSLVPPLDVDAASDGGAPVIVPQRVRAVIEGGGFSGVEFNPLRLLKVKSSQHDTFTELPWPIATRKWWIVESSVMLPPCSDYLKVVGPNREVHPRGSRIGRLVEVGFSDVERHYLRSELDAIGAFDVAQEWESGGAREIIVSSRFYRFCREQKLGIDFVPVRIDEG